MLNKTRIIFNESIKDMWIYYNKFRRSMHDVLMIFQEFYLEYPGAWYIELQGNNFVFHMKFNYPENDDHKNKIFDEETTQLRNNGFDPCYKDKEYFLISMDNLVQVLLEK